MEQARRQYNRRLVLAIVVYAAILGPSIPLISANPDAAWRFPLAIAPILPFIYGIVGYVRYLRSVDELQRRIALEALAIAFGASAAITFGYGLLQIAGLPEINWSFVWAVMGGCWILGAIYADRRYR